MKKLITNLKVLMTLLLLCGVSSAWASTVEFSDGAGWNDTQAAQTYTDATSGITIATSKGVYNGNYRAYKGETFSVSIAKGNITKIEMTCTASGTNQYGPGCYTLTSEGGTYSYDGTLGTWEGTSQSVVLKATGAQVRMTKIVVTYQIAEGEVASPSFTPANDEFIGSVDVTLTAEDGTKIYYTTDGTDPTTSSTEYTAAITLTATTTVKAIAAKDGKTSKVASKTYTKIPVYASLAELINAEPTTAGYTVRVTLTNEVITGLDSNRGIMLQVGDKEIEVFCYNRPEEWVVNGTVSGTLTCTWKDYQGTWELCPSSWNDLTYAEPFVQKYTINIADGIVGGAVSTDPADEAAEGKTVSLIATPNAGYALNAWTVEDADGNPVAVTDGTFVMPAKEVYVSATFTEAQYLFYESFNTNSGKGGNDGQWSGNIASSDLKSDNTWTMENAKGADKCAKFGSGSKAGSATTPVINATGDLTLVFKAAAWSGATENTTLNITSSNGTLSTSEITLTKGAWKTYKVYIYGAEDPQITIKAALASNNRFFLDEVYVLPYNTDIVEIGASGYATYSSETYTVIPDPESGVQFFGAKINDEGTAVTLIPTAEGQAIGLKGEGFIVKATPNTTVFIEKTGENGGSIEDNQLVGTVHSEYDLTQGEAYLLSATSDGTPFFGLCNEGTLAPFKAFLPVPAPGVKEILAIEEGGTTGINTIKNAELNIQDAIYNLAGQKVGADYKGIVIRNGKKMLNK